MSNKVSLPKTGQARNSLLEQLQKFHDQDSQWKDGRTWSLVYHAGNEHTDFLKKAYSIYFHQNGLNPGAFPSLKKFEAEVVSITANLFHGGDEAGGTMTSGGSESILMAVKTTRDWMRVKKPEIKNPEMIVPQSIHPAFDKAAHYLDVKIIKVPLTSNYGVDMAAVEKAITPNTILLVGSAPQYPHGVMDPLKELAALAKKKDLALHVDACVGGFILPFIKKAGYPVPDFDFSIPEVTSISADLHKYGFAAKGASVVMYKNKEIRNHQFFVSSDWPGGAFASPSASGTRPAGSIAAAWATLMAYGEDGYVAQAKEIMKIAETLKSGVKELGFELVVEPVCSIFAFTCKDADIFAVGDQMQARGWHIDRQQFPNCIHLMVTPAHAQATTQFLKDLKDSKEFVKAHPETAQSGTAAMYGMMAKVPDPKMIDQFLYQYMNERYEA